MARSSMNTSSGAVPPLVEVARYRVVFADCDPMRIMYYASYYRLFEIGRAELFRKLGHPFPTYIAQGLYLGVIESHGRYLKPARYDDQLTIRAGVSDIGRVRLTIQYEIADLDATVLANGYTVHVVMNEAGRPVRIPPKFVQAA